MDFLQLRGRMLIDAIRQQPEFAVFAKIPATPAAISSIFEITPAGAVTLGPAALSSPTTLPFHLRLALEMAYLSNHGLGKPLAALAAARAAAVFATEDADALPAWAKLMARDAAPAEADLQRVADTLPGGPATRHDIAAIREVWSLLGPAEALMETGGDIRLQTDPRSALNGYGCSHRPRPWAVTFASSTASSSSERGFAGADRERLRTTLALFRRGKRAAVRHALQKVRASITKSFALPADSAVILAASGTDTELLALAITHLAPQNLPILNILIAPEETGRGVPMAARGRHFAVNTALGHEVNFEAPIAGFRDDTELANVALRDAGGTVRPHAEIEAQLHNLVARGIAAGKHVLLHTLDLSKTGLLAPRPAFLATLRAEFGAHFDIVVDACQTRLSAASINAYLALNALVLITGSKFLTGPPFAGAALVPGPLAARLAAGALPEGLGAYFGRDEFPEHCPAASVLPPIGNYGLALRWHAALAELRALNRIPLRRRADIITAFGAVVIREAAANPSLTLLPQPAFSRTGSDEPWELCPSIFSLAIKAPHAPGRCLTPVEARAMYLWLNTDLSPWLRHAGTVASRICHIGQPVKLPQTGVESGQGVLRISAGARLISGEPSHKGLRFKTRLQREMNDLAMVFNKIDLILRNWALLWAADPAPRYRPETMAGSPPHEIVIE
jgi:hypothetical protein